MKLKKLLLLIIISIFFFLPVAEAKDDIVIKEITPVKSTDGIILNSAEKIDVVFNDLGQTAKYNIVIKNNTKKDLYINSLQVEGSSQDFIKYSIDDLSRSKNIKAGSKGTILVNIITQAEKFAGKNLNDTISLKFLLKEKIENPPTSSNLGRTIILVIISAIAITIVMTKFNNKKSTIATIIVCFMLLGTSFVFADDTIIIESTGKVSYYSQNLLEASGTIVNGTKLDYTSSKDIWMYYDKIKNINISGETSKMEDYSHRYDLTIDNKKRVMAYLKENGDTSVPYDLYIMANGVIYAPDNASALFAFTNVENINGLENVMFDNTSTMKGMFSGNQRMKTLNASAIDTTNIKDTSYMFYKCYNYDIDENSFNLENVEIRNNMFVQYLLKEMKKGAQSDEKIDFSTISSSTNGQGIYLRSGTENNENPIYYYRGAVTNNNVKFANKCWKIVRTTETGGVKLIYNGVPSSSGACDKTGTNTLIGTGAFNSSYDSPAYEGYMYGKVYSRLVKDAYNISAGTVYGNDIEYKDGKYYLKETYTSENGWSTDYKTIGEKYHYTCFSTENSCETVNYIYSAGNSSTAYYIPLTEGKTQLNLLDEMLTNSTNKISSTIKNKIDTWYKNNMINYTSYLEDTVWCNDRSIYQLNGWDKNTNATKDMNFGSYGRLVVKNNLSLKCPSTNDSFTVSSENGNGKLTYPIALLTADELILAGAKWDSPNYNFYLYTGQNIWTMTPSYFNGTNTNGFRLRDTGALNNYGFHGYLGIRPAISLKAGIDYVSGTGTKTNPYVID